MRPYVKGELVVVFGAGGDRDPGKRPMMGAIAAQMADRVIVTDDNPRSENPAAIRAAILKAAPGASEIGDRGEAIRVSIATLKAGDVLLIAGKGHESGQIVGDRVLPFSDHEAVAQALGEKVRMSAALWTVKAMADAMQAHVRGPLPAFVGGLSIDSRTLAAGRRLLRHHRRQSRRPRLCRERARGEGRPCGGVAGANASNSEKTRRF